MEQKRKFNMKTTIIGLIVVLIIAIVAISVLNRPKNGYHGMHIVFEEDTPAEAIQSIIERYSPDEAFNNFPRYVRMTFFHKSEREVKELASQIMMDEEYVIKASYVRVSASALNYPK